MTDSVHPTSGPIDSHSIPDDPYVQGQARVREPSHSPDSCACPSIIASPSSATKCDGASQERSMSTERVAAGTASGTRSSVRGPTPDTVCSPTTGPSAGITTGVATGVGSGLASGVGSLATSATLRASVAVATHPVVRTSAATARTRPLRTRRARVSAASPQIIPPV